MTLYFVRHGIAEDLAPAGGDAERRLTQHGTLRTAIVAKGLRQFGVAFDLIITSPYVRAVQTAEILARVTDYQSELLQDPRLVPYASFEDASELIHEHKGHETILLVGHQPSMGRIISGIVGGGQLSFDVKKASVTAVQIDRLSRPTAGSLLWTMPPRLFERMPA